ncbi:MAG: FRG domain-containing protein [Candidatus Poribacteria bacterium]|nr:FRG domain-containing protein [Candidatus Poribacteria bacterium]
MARSSPNSLNEVFEKIQEIAAKSKDSDFIYRGEPEHFVEEPYHEKVSSSLWRECRKEIGKEEFNIEAIQDQMLKVAKDYTHEEDTFEILTELQHFGGYTNLIDFTTDSHIALFFACESSLDKTGRMILLERREEIDKEYKIKRPQNPQNRIIAQKSIFVRPPMGFLERKQYTVIDIPGLLKKPILVHLQKHHGISIQTVYNDLHGYIRNQDTHLKEGIEVYISETQPTEDVLQITDSQSSKKGES